jgi:hypothetical protein
MGITGISVYESVNEIVNILFGLCFLQSFVSKTVSTVRGFNSATSFRVGQSDRLSLQSLESISTQQILECYVELKNQHEGVFKLQVL